MSINYLDILKKSWSLTWHNKYLWWFGLFTALSGFGGRFNYQFPGPGKQPSIAPEKIWDFVVQHWPVVIFSSAVLLLILLALAVLGIIGRGALIKSINAEINPPADQTASNFKTGFAAGKKYFWKLFVLGLSLGFSILAILIVLLIPIIFLFTNHAYALGTILALAGFLFFLPLLILVIFLKTYGQLYIVLGNLAVWPAIENSYALFLKNISPSIIMSLIFLLTSLIFGLAVLAAVIPVIIVFVIFGTIAYLLFKIIGLAIIAGLGIIILLVLMLAAKSIYETFAQAVWIFFFHEIARPKVAETISETAPEIKPVPEATPNPVTFSEE